MDNRSSIFEDARITAALKRSLELGQMGVAIAAYNCGRLIVYAIAGTLSEASSDLVTKETLFSVFSVAKSVTALAVHIQAECGLLGVQDLISKYWPEFRVNGKNVVTIEDAHSHRAGIPQMPAGITQERMADWDWMVKHVAQFKPVFPPGETNAYHVLVWGWILGEVVRRTDKAYRPFEVFVYEEICKPLGMTDFYQGVPSDKLGRVAILSGGNSFAMVDEHGISPAAVFPGSKVHNTPIVQQCVDPGAGSIATAPSIARIFALIAEGGELDGVRLLSRERAAGLTRSRQGAHDADKVLPLPVWFGAAEFWLGGDPNASDPLVGDHRDIMCSPGAGGSIAWADLRDRLAVAICHNNMDSIMVLEPERTFAPIVKAVREVVAEIGTHDL